MPPDPQHPPNESEGDKEKNETLESPVPIFLGQQPHQGHGVLNGAIQGVTLHVPLKKQAIAPFCLANCHNPGAVSRVRIITASQDGKRWGSGPVLVKGDEGIVGWLGEVAV